MRTPDSIDHLTGTEQTNLRCIKNKIVGQFHPLLIYYFDSHYSTCVKRSCFAAKTIEEKTFSCSILIVLPNDMGLLDNMQDQVTKMTNDFGKVAAFFCALDGYIQHLNERNLFFAWVRRNAVILYEKDNASARLPEAISKRHYRKQAECFYVQNPTFTNYLQEKMLPLSSEITS